MENTDNATQNEQYRVQHRHLILLLFLAIATFSLFFVTKIIAAKSQALDAHVAAIWHSKGEMRLRAGDTEGAVEAFRKASAGAHFNREYALSLASALAMGKHKAEALQTLMRLRESDPEDAQINLFLARLQSELGKTDEAVQFYENSLYGRWTGSEIDERRREVRIELVRMLIEHNLQSRAISELLILQTELPSSAPLHSECGRLFLEAGDAQDALGQFKEALRVDRDFDAALMGAGEASFQLAEYSDAVRYLSAADEESRTKESERMLELSRLVLANDPLANHLGAQERRRRVTTALDRALERAQECMSSREGDATPTALETVISQAKAERSQLLPKKVERNPEVARSATELIYRLELASRQECGTGAEIDQALLLIGRKHGVR